MIHRKRKIKIFWKKMKIIECICQAVLSFNCVSITELFIIWQVTEKRLNQFEAFLDLKGLLLKLPHIVTSR